MKLAKWNEKVSAIFEDASLYPDADFHYDVDDSGAYFCKSRFYAFYMPGETIYGTGNNDRKAPLSALFQTAIKNGKLANVNETGTLDCKKGKVRKLANDTCTAYVQEKFLRIFPKNTSYYICGHNRPVVAGIWENDKLNVIGIVMPIIGYHFLATNG